MDELAYLAYVGDFEHLLVVQGLLRFDDTWQVNELRRVQVVASVKYRPPRI